ncbi:hypothetical protein AM1_C0129 (plasmid) [Acaryochloris marina MBIC11017]|uniref:Uncharacterized protein n=1 Tax=Acaryochloris marina (strain MBIC 11017) TaxID=329726 RepID=A8ZMM5_ACAM1|nr:hypothetical protein AM1_C0129 [Acaryochloris marina MBIC11017]
MSGLKQKSLAANLEVNHSSFFVLIRGSLASIRLGIVQRPIV